MRVKLEDVCERGTSSLMQKDIVDKNGKYPVYGASGRIGSMETYQQEHQTVAVVKDGAGIGRTMLLPEKSSVIGTMQYLIPKNCIESEYLYYVVKYMHLEKYFSGATIPHIYFRDYKTEEFNLHDKTEQREIVSTLKRIEAIISNRQEQLTKLDELVKARFVEMFGDPANNPHKWKTLSFKQAGVRLSDGPFGSNLKSAHYTDSGVRVIRLGNIGVGKFIDNDRSYISLSHYECLKKYTCRAGEIVIGTLGDPNLRACIIPSDIKYAVNKADCVHYIPNPTLLNTYFVCQYINCPETLLLATKMIHGQTRSRVSSGQLAQLPIFVPPLSLQNQFADFVAEVDKSKADVQKALDQTQLLFDSLMQQYFG